MDMTTAPPEIDFPARRLKVSTWLRTHPERHDQNLWLEDGRGPDARMGVAGAAASYYAPLGTAWCDGQVMLPDGEVWDIDDYAQEYLGLDDEQANSIFNCLNNAEALRYLEAA